MMSGMDANADARFPGYRFPAVIIGEVVWLRYRFNLSLRDIPALVARSGIVVSHETVRAWCEMFDPDYAKQVRRRRPRPGDKRHLDELVIRMNWVQHYLWRAVDQRGACLGVLVTRRRDAHAARTFLRKLLKSQGYTPWALITDKLRSHGAAKREVMASVCHGKASI